jgi:hypothetical protein
MVRSCLLVAAVLFATSALAAPVPNTKEAKRKEMDRLHGILQHYGPTSAVAGLLPLSAMPADDVVPYIAGKLKPLKLTEERAKELIADLGSEKKEVYEAAFEEMKYFDTRLVMTPQDAFALAPQGPARQRLAAAWDGYPIDQYADAKLEIRNAILKHQDGTLVKRVVLGVARNKKNMLPMSHEIALTTADLQLGTWRQAARSIYLLEHFGTPDAVKAIKDMASGHEDAIPTKAAKGALERLTAKAPPKPGMEKVWADLLGCEDAAVARAILVLNYDKAGALDLLKREMRPLKLDEKRFKELLSDLGGEDEKLALAARQEFEYFHPLLAGDVDKLSAAAPDGLARTRLFEILCLERPFDSYRGQKLILQEQDGAFSLESKGQWTGGVSQRVLHLHPAQWARLSVGIALLEQIGTPEAVKVLEGMAGGHKEAQPTQDAKFVLERLKKK